jgi:hypothetical protein
MAKRIGFEVISTRPVCVDFRDGRAISFRPGHRFKSTLTNTSVLRLLRAGEIRKLSPFEPVPPMPVGLGEPRHVQNIKKARAEVAQAKKAALAKLEASRKAPPKIEVAKPAPKKKSKKSTSSKSTETENK